MNLLYLTIFGLLIFLSLLIGGKKFRVTALYALAIGGAVNANFFHAENYPIDIFGLSFGIDSIIYSLFIFCIIVTLFQYGKKDAYTLAASSIIAIMLSAIFELISKLLSSGYNNDIWNNFIDFICSSITSIIVIVVIIEILSLLSNKTKLKNQYILLIIGMIIAIVINTPIYYTFESLVHGRPDNIGELVSTSFLGKLLSIPLAILSLFLINLYDNRHTKK